MTEHGLNGAQVGAALQKMRCERVPQDVRREFLFDSSLSAVALEDSPEARTREFSAAIIQEDVFRRLLDFASSQVGNDRVARRSSHWDDALLAPFAHTADNPEVQIHSVHFESDQLRY